MPPVNQALVNEFRAKAEATNAVVREAVDLDAALNYVVEVCRSEERRVGKEC